MKNFLSVLKMATTVYETETCLGDRGDRSDQNFPNGLYFSGHANYIDRSILDFAAIVRLAIEAASTIVAIVAIIWKPGINGK